MSYIGKEPQFTQFPSKFFDGDGSAMTVTLDYAPPNPAALLVFISGVRQDTSAYSLSGTSLTFTGSVPSGTSNVQVVHLGLTVDVGVPGDDTVTLAKLEDGTQGDILYYGASGAPARLGFGTSGYFLKTQGTGANPVWSAVTAYTAGDGLDLSGAEFSVDFTSDNSWTGSQRSTAVTDNDGSYDMDAGQNFITTPSGSTTITFTNITNGQSGFIKLINSGGETISLHANTKGDANIATTVSTAGTYLLSYFSDGTDVWLTNSAIYA